MKIGCLSKGRNLSKIYHYSVGVDHKLRRIQVLIMFPLVNLSIRSLFRFLARSSTFHSFTWGFVWVGVLMVIVVQEEGYRVRFFGLRGTLMWRSSVLAWYERYGTDRGLWSICYYIPTGGGGAFTGGSSIAMKVQWGSNEWVVQDREQLEVLQLLKRGRVIQNWAVLHLLSWSYRSQVWLASLVPIIPIQTQCSPFPSKYIPHHQIIQYTEKVTPVSCTNRPLP
jgi:hypothetical protein